MDFSGSLVSKLPQVKTTIFSEMTALAEQHQAVNLSQGFPDFDMDPALLACYEEASRKGYNQYAPMAGWLPLRENLASMLNNLYSCPYDPGTEITITAGGTQALFTAIMAFVREGDEVVVFEPAYDSYVPAITLAGGIPKFIRLEGPDFSIPWQAVRKVLNQRSRMVILNTPHNPTGKVWSAQDMEQLAQLLRGKDIIVLSDEVYGHILYDGLEHQSVCRFPELATRSIVVGSFGKTYHCTGWKVGFAAGPTQLMQEFRKVHQFNVFSVNTPAQMAFASVLSQPETYLKLPAFYGTKRDFFLSCMKDLPFLFRPVQGSYFALADYSPVSDENDRDFAIRLTREAGVATVPLSAFYSKSKDEKLLRFCFAKKEETIQEAADRLKKWMNSK